MRYLFFIFFPFFLICQKTNAQSPFLVNPYLQVGYEGTQNELSLLWHTKDTLCTWRVEAEKDNRWVASKVITINSKTGYEALISNKPLCVFGESYYKKLSFVSYCNLNNINLNQTKKIIQKKLNKFFRKLYYKTFNGQLYYLEKTNINNFVKSINNLKI